MRILLHLRVTNPENDDLMESHHLSRVLAEGKFTWEHRFKNNEFCILFWRICKNAGLNKKGIETLMEAMPQKVKSLATFCRYVYTIMLLWGFHREDIIKPSCIFGLLRLSMNKALENTYEKFQSKWMNVIQEGTDQDNITREVFQAAVNKILPSGIFNFKVKGKSKSISFVPILVTGNKSKKGALQLRDVVLEENGFATVRESCTLMDTMKSELGRLGYSGDADKHITSFVRGLEKHI
jgi:hypothetical protein